jgi:dTDP-glucose 4,6-dehydratase
MLVRSYHKTYGLNTVITNCSNNFGPRQHDEKLIPTIIQKALAAQPIPIYGNGHNIRDWLYVTDHCDGLAVAFHKGTQGEVYNIGAEQEYSNLTLCHEVCHLLDQLKPRDQNGSYKELIHFVTDRAGHDFRYAVNHHKISQLGWKPKFAFKQALEKTIAAYQQRYAK